MARCELKLVLGHSDTPERIAGTLKVLKNHGRKVPVWKIWNSISWGVSSALSYLFCAEKLWMPQQWKCSKGGWRVLWVTSVKDVPGQDELGRSLPIHTALSPWFWNTRGFFLYLTENEFYEYEVPISQITGVTKREQLLNWFLFSIQSTGKCHFNLDMENCSRP